MTFILGSTDDTLPRLEVGKILDFAYVDGCHGYPFPALDWHYIDKHLKIGGLLGMDNVELRPIREHCEFLEENEVYRLAGIVIDGCFVRFYEKQAGQNANGSTNVTAEPSRTRATGGCRPGSGERSVNCSSRTCTSDSRSVWPTKLIYPNRYPRAPAGAIEKSRGAKLRVDAKFWARNLVVAIFRKISGTCHRAGTSYGARRT